MDFDIDEVVGKRTVLLTETVRTPWKGKNGVEGTELRWIVMAFPEDLPDLRERIQQAGGVVKEVQDLTNVLTAASIAKLFTGAKKEPMDVLTQP